MLNVSNLSPEHAWIARKGDTDRYRNGQIFWAHVLFGNRRLGYVFDTLNHLFESAFRQVQIVHE